MIHRLALALGRPARLLALPSAWLRLAAAVSWRGAEIDRLLGSLALDTGAIRRDLDWRPPNTLDQGLTATCRAWQCP